MNAWESNVAGNRAVQPGAAAAEKSFGGRYKLMGIIMLVIFLQVLLFLVYVDASPLIPGSFSGYGNAMLFYLILESGVALPIIGFSPALIGSKIHVNLVTGGGVFRFLANGAITGFLAWGLMALALNALHANFVLVSGAARLSGILFISVFTAFAEELTFRAALPLIGNWFLMSCVAFAGAHLIIDSATIGLGDLVGITSAFIQRMIAGLILWMIYRYAGFGPAVFSHFAYDGVISGYLSGQFPLDLSHAGLVLV